MKVGKLLVVALLTALSTSGIIAQDTLRVVAKTISNKNNEILVRWAPTNYATWKAGIANGYQLFRYTYAVAGNISGIDEYEASKVDLGVLMVAPESEWEPFAQTDELAGIAVGCIYGDSLDILPAGGASLVNVYNKSKETTTRFGWSLLAADQKFQIAQMMGLGYLDQTVEKDNEYVYVVTAKSDPAFFQQPGVTRALYTGSDPVIPAPQNLSYEPKDHGALIKWNPSTADFSSFDIERSDDGGIHFQKVNTSPIIYTFNGLSSVFSEASFLDSLAKNDVVYIYRVSGRTAFGMVSPPSDTLHVKGMMPRLDLVWNIDEVTETEHSVAVKWVFPSSLNAQINGFEIWRARSKEGPFVKISGSSPISVTLRSWQDNSPEASNYYVVKTKDVNNYGYETFSMLGQPKDKTPPLPPTTVLGECSATGMVKLNWSKSSSSDVMGYRVFTANVQNGEYQQITSVWVQDTFFHWEISLNTLTEDVWFGVKAIDFRQNQSDMSQPVRVIRPDIVPPSPPIIKSVNTLASGVRFAFTLSSSTDVVSYRFERKRQGIPGWTPLTAFPVSTPAYGYFDASGDKRKVYEYRLLAIDDAGLLSSSEIIKAQKIDDGLRHAIENLTAHVTVSADKIVQLSWDYAYDQDVIGFEVYRAVLDTNKQRSYAFVRFPQAPNNNPGFSGTVSLGGGMIHTAFTDYDVAFNAPQLKDFQYFASSGLSTNQSISGQIQDSATTGSYHAPNPNNMNGQNVAQPYKLYYWVVARFADGGASPTAGWVMVEMN